MANAPGIPNNFNVQQANQQILVSWDLTTSATAYLVERSLDNVTFSTLATVSGSPLATSYLDSAVNLNTQYWYRTSAINSNGTGLPTTPQSAIPTPSGELSLQAIRLKAKQRADRVNSDFVTLTEWNSYINQSMFELYDLLVTLYEDYFIATPASFASNGSQYLFPLPDGSTTFTNSDTGATFVAPPMYKLLGVDMRLQSATNAWVTLNKFNFIDRNTYVFPNTASTIYGVFNARYRMMGTNLEMIPTPSGGQTFRLWYVPRLTELLQDTDTTTAGISGWIEYVIVKAAYYALTKEEADTTPLVLQLAALQKRIEESAANRDAGLPDTVSDTRRGSYSNGWNGNNGPIGGWALTPFIPSLAQYNQTNAGLADMVFSSQSSLAYAASLVLCLYFFYLLHSKFGSGITFSRIRDLATSSLSTFFNHIVDVIFRSSKKQMVRIDADRVITSMANVQPIGNRTFKKFIANSTSISPVAFNRKQSSFTIRMFFTQPNPTVIGFYKFIKKSIFHLLTSRAHIKAICRWENN